MKNHHVISIRDLSRNDIDHLIDRAHAHKRGEAKPLPSNTKIASLFFENSTRTRLSSETAAINLGGYINGFAGVEGTSVNKGEPLIDTVRMLECYGYNAIVMRHPLAGAARFAADNLSIPIVNGGDGPSGHPTQTLLDLFTIHETHKKIDGLTIAMVGDLKYGRTVHSLLEALELYNANVILVSPGNLNMPEWRVNDYERHTNRKVEINPNLPDVLSKADVVYVTRIQRERFPAGIEGDSEFKKVAGQYVITKNILEAHAKKNLIVLHPLPRDKKNIEITTDVDQTPYQRYLEQAKNGLYMREAIWARVLGEGFEGRPRHPESPSSWIELPIENGRKSGEKLVYRLDEGTLIDHLDGGTGMKAFELLKLNSITDSEIMLAMNIRSKRQGRKDVLAIHGKQLATNELYRLALLSPHHTINIIQNQRVIQKMKAVLPSPLRDLVTCKNPSCISRREHHEFAPSLFHVEDRDNLTIRCHYCENIQTGGQFELL